MLRNLVDFALSSHLPDPPRLLFISSTDTLRATSEGSPDATSERGGTADPAPSEGPVSLSACDAAGGAYGESKWVGEQILAAAASETPLRPIIIRVGPLCGAANGRWREEAHFPTIVHLGVTLGALPKIDEVRLPSVAFVMMSSPRRTRRSYTGYRSTPPPKPSPRCATPTRPPFTSPTPTPSPPSPSSACSVTASASRSSRSVNGPPCSKPTSTLPLSPRRPPDSRTRRGRSSGTSSTRGTRPRPTLRRPRACFHIRRSSRARRGSRRRCCTGTCPSSGATTSRSGYGIGERWAWSPHGGRRPREIQVPSLFSFQRSHLAGVGSSTFTLYDPHDAIVSC